MAVLRMPVALPYCSFTRLPPSRNDTVRACSNAHAPQTFEPTVARRSANYQPCIWDYDYVQSLKSHYVGETYMKCAKKLKRDVRIMFVNVVEPLAQLELIDVLQRLGVAYQFEEDIKRTLDTIYISRNNDKWMEEDLHSTALHFRLLRQHGFHVPQEVFNSFKDKKGNFKTFLCADTKGILSLYEASYFALEGENILEEAKDFTSKHLRHLKGNINANLAKQVNHALELPLHWRMLRLEARWFVDIYERRGDMNPKLLEFAKLEFNMVQETHQNDLKEMSRRMTTKVNALITTIEDVYDVYGTLDELELFTDAIERWDINAVERLPDYMKICFLALYNSINEMSYDTLKEKGWEKKRVEEMADAVVGVLVQSLYTTLVSESQFPLEFQNQFEDMKKRLEIMQAFLNDTEGLKKKNETVKKTLTDLRELIYEADDILLDCLIRAYYRKDDSFLHRHSPRELRFRYKKGKKLSEINIRITKMEESLRTYLAPIIRQASQEEHSNRGFRWTSQAFDQSAIVGLKDDTRKIKGWIKPRNEVLHRVGILGMGGLGKTTIAQKIFNDKDVVERFTKRIWVSVSQTINETAIMKSMLKQLGNDGNGCDDGMLLNMIQQELSNKTYLIVMDDVWSIDDGWWARIFAGLPKTEGYSSSIIITTRKDDVLRSMGVEEERTHKPKVLKEDESWSLFCKAAFSGSKTISKYPELKGVGKEIVKKCQGLPLAIKTIGGLLSSKPYSLSQWEGIRDTFHDQLTTDQGDTSIISSLQLSYDELPSHLKQCLLCFSIYPEDYEISAEQLVHWWIGEGFVWGKNLKTASESAFDCLSELVNRCLVEVVHRRNYDGRVYSCTMHDMVRDLAIKVAREEAFCSFDGRGRQIPTANSRRLGFTSKMDMRNLEGNSKLRALLLMPSSSIHFDRKTGLARVKSLRVLDFSQNKLDNVCNDDLLYWIISLNRLAYLNLRGVAGLRELPYSIWKLRNLQILVLNECNDLEKLPPCITTLKKLTVLDVGTCSSLQYLPQGIGRLSNLQELSGLKLASPAIMDTCRLGELKDLVQLRVLRINVSKEGEIADKELDVLLGLEKLEVLSINTEECENMEIIEKLNKLSPPPHLQVLYLRYYRGDATPGWINPKSLSKLQYLCIENGELKQVNEGFWGSESTTWKLQGLCLKYLPRLYMEWEWVQKRMPLLSYLEVSHCYMFKKFPCEVINLGSWRKDEEQESEDGEKDKE
ncbi:hypothetical protein HHK36_003461 [Tetracentron sinense]|uniref:Uncharacterized protein n=1 Tax=Tetracentron sinense TaxID=13715 RepID=A0A834ZN98_TETSI|nr:hypothetical protein HHK36_003461 [Tetracentron sinense]